MLWTLKALISVWIYLKKSLDMMSIHNSYITDKIGKLLEPCSHKIIPNKG